MSVPLTPMEQGLVLAGQLGHTMGPVEPAGPMGGSIRSTCTVCQAAVIVTRAHPTGSATFHECAPPAEPRYTGGSVL